ncbi:MAG: DUF5063 domain-containing protein [Acidobacteriota bacterium]|nr:MAG: DUF5063 domain-containing protein [Acidobacteriota bacterium]
METIPESVENFAKIARRYCEWAEAERGDPDDEMVVAREILAELHLAIIRLPNLGFDDDDDQDEVTWSADEWRKIRDSFRDLPVQGHWDVFDPLVEEAPVFNTLGDDLADIYADLKDGLAHHDAGRIGSAVWEWRFSFSTHWGRHLTSAQRAIYAHFFNQY